MAGALSCAASRRVVSASGFRPTGAWRAPRPASRLGTRGACARPLLQLVPRASASDDKESLASTGGVPPPAGGAPSGGGGGGDGDGAGAGTGAGAGALLAGKALEKLPADLADALKRGALPDEILQRYLSLEGNVVLRWLLQFQPFRERLLADPGFFIKVAIEVGIGICTKLTAEYTKRGDAFQSQLDFVTANVIMALIADFMLVWLPAPTFSTRPAGTAAAGALAKLFAGCPDNAFQKVQPGYPAFTLGQRAGAVVRNGAKLLGVGFFASMLGVGITNVLLAVRTMMDPSFVPLNDPQNVVVMSAAYGSYMATSSNLRYQILAGIIEERGIETWFHSNPAACAVLSFAVRTGNTFLGSLLWVDYLHLLGLQKVAAH